MHSSYVEIIQMFINWGINKMWYVLEWGIICQLEEMKFWFMLQHRWTKNTTVSERNQKQQKAGYCVISFTWNVQARLIPRD